MLAVNVAAWLLYLVALIVLGRGVIKKMPSGRVDFSWAAFSVSPASTALIVQRRAANVFHKTQRFEPGRHQAATSIGNPAAFHSGKPFSKRRTLKPRGRSAATASNERTQ